MSTKSDITDQDLLAAREREADQQLEASLFNSGSQNVFWSDLIGAGVIKTGDKALVMDFINLYTEKHNMDDFFLESGMEFTKALNKIIALYPNEKFTQQIDLALTIVAKIGMNTPKYLDNFRTLALDPYIKASSTEEFQVFRSRLMKQLANAAAIEAAKFAELQITGKISHLQSPRTEIRALDDLSRYGDLYDNNVFQNFLNILSSRTSSGYEHRQACIAMTALVNAKTVPFEHPVFRHTIRHLLTCVHKIGGSTMLTALKCLKDLLKRQDLHEIFVDENGCVHLLNIVKKTTKYMQPVYLAGFCFWLLSYNSKNNTMFHDLRLVSVFANLIKNSSREKIVRISLSVLLNLCDKPDFIEEMIGADLQKIFASVLLRKWKDDDIAKYAEEIQAILTVKINDLSSFEMYRAELVSGLLRKSPVHNEKFWRENHNKFTEDNYELIKLLISQLTSDNAESVEMACYDLGEFARFHPDGKTVIQKYDGKTKLMTLMTHTDANVSKAALLAVQKIVIHKWDNMVNQQAKFGK